jgi:hypothetical protein
MIRFIDDFTRMAFVTALLLCSCCGNRANSQDAERDERPNSFSLELLGKCGFYSIGYQKMLSSSFAIEGVTAYFQEKDLKGDLFGSMAVAGYLKETLQSPFIGVGITAFTAPSNGSFLLDHPNNRYVYLMMGYEERHESGIVMRTAIYFYSVGHWLVLWPGVQLGYDF